MFTVVIGAARYIIRDDGVRIDLRYAKPDGPGRMLRVGFTVERHLKDDDVVLFNRQPSLHKVCFSSGLSLFTNSKHTVLFVPPQMSIMCHRVKVLDWSTFRMNLTCTRPYNADFDGDEMNLHVPQTLPAAVEARELMSVHRLMISPQANRPVMGIVQDALVGAFLMSQQNVFVTRESIMDLAIASRSGWAQHLPASAIMLPHKGYPGRYTPIWTGKQALSLSFPRLLNYGQRIHGLGVVPVIIAHGELLCGHLDKKTLGTSEGSIVHVLMNDGTAEVARDCLDKVGVAVVLICQWSS